jgi:Carboxypeptidase regulatory-like domain
MHFRLYSVLLLCIRLLAAVAAGASVNGSISGLVTGPSGAVVVEAQVVAVEVQTGVRTETITDSKGFFSLPTLPMESYNIDIRAPGFKAYQRSGLVTHASPADGTQQIGVTGNSNRRFFHGPGHNNWDTALLKESKFMESKILEMRFEAFNIFNHAQFQNPNGNIDAGFPNFVNGVNQGGRFGLVAGSNAGRMLQLAAKVQF